MQVSNFLYQEFHQQNPNLLIYIGLLNLYYPVAIMLVTVNMNWLHSCLLFCVFLHLLIMYQTYIYLPTHGFKCSSNTRFSKKIKTHYFS